MLKNVKAVIFDVDGTIIDSIPIWRQINAAVMKELGIQVSQEDIEKLLSQTIEESILYCKHKFNIESSVDQLKDLWNKIGIEYYKTKINLSHGVQEFLNSLRNSNFKVGIATNTCRTITEFLFYKERLMQYFDYVCTCDDVSKPKPSPEMYIKVAQYLKVDIEGCLLFEDSKSNMKTAKEMGLKVCAVVGTHTKDEVKHFSDYQISNFHEVSLFR